MIIFASDAAIDMPNLVRVVRAAHVQAICLRSEERAESGTLFKIVFSSVWHKTWGKDEILYQQNFLHQFLQNDRYQIKEFD